MNNDERLFTLLIYIAVGMIMYVTVIGGIVCIKESAYNYADYLSDLTNVVPYLFGAVIAVLLRSLVRTRNGNGNGKPKPPPQYDR